MLSADSVFSGIVLTPGPRAMMVVNALGRSTVDRGHHGPACIIVKIPGLGDGVIFGDLSLLERWCSENIHKKVAGVHGRQRAQP